ncbi:hypothetical protein F5890DRAFT_177394 [Lentinula detonsa]|uniref:Uncharacterized protein n=1 Tax=Lentinula detonsa TaxID=2804962 RepID=A0AA38Q9C1_9AGAR|nr:hypothetical protein F5890DRAFT_177394 [Lentinula detonsa]
MLARISKGTARALGLTFTRGRSPHRLQESVSITEETEEVIIDLDVLLLPIHDFLVPWWRYTGECRRTLAPVCNNIQSLLSDDVERIAELLASLECSDEDQECDFDTDSEVSEDVDIPCSMNIGPESNPSAPYRERPPHRQRSHPKAPIVMPGSCASIPTIIITPCETQVRETSALVPIQDGAFGSRLSVPCHPKINHAFPPMASTMSSIHMMRDLDWTWSNGHWVALLPGVVEQMSKGMFSKAMSRRKVSRRFRTHSTTNRNIAYHY